MPTSCNLKKKGVFMIELKEEPLLNELDLLEDNELKEEPLLNELDLLEDNELKEEPLLNELDLLDKLYDDVWLNIELIRVLFDEGLLTLFGDLMLWENVMPVKNDAESGLDKDMLLVEEEEVIGNLPLFKPLPPFIPIGTVCPIREISLRFISICWCVKNFPTCVLGFNLRTLENSYGWLYTAVPIFFPTFTVEPFDIIPAWLNSADATTWLSVDLPRIFSPVKVNWLGCDPIYRLISLAVFRFLGRGLMKSSAT